MIIDKIGRAFKEMEQMHKKIQDHPQFHTNEMNSEQQCLCSQFYYYFALLQEKNAKKEAIRL